MQIDYCDYCGEIIKNYHKRIVDKGNKLYSEIYKLHELNQKKNVKGFFKRLFFIPELPKELRNEGTLCFCNEEHYNKFRENFAVSLEGGKQ